MGRWMRGLYGNVLLCIECHGRLNAACTRPMTYPVVAAIIDCMPLQGCLGVGCTDSICILYERLPAVVLLKDGNLLHCSIRGEDRVQGVDSDRVHLVFNLQHRMGVCQLSSRPESLDNHELSQRKVQPG